MERVVDAAFSPDAGQFILYFLFSIVLAMAIGMMVVMAMIVTCCFCCMMLLPYVGTVVLLPVLMFKRCYSLYFLAQFGREYDVFPPPASASHAASDVKRLCDCQDAAGLLLISPAMEFAFPRWENRLTVSALMTPTGAR